MPPPSPCRLTVEIDEIEVRRAAAAAEEAANAAQQAEAAALSLAAFRPWGAADAAVSARGIRNQDGTISAEASGQGHEGNALFDGVDAETPEERKRRFGVGVEGEMLNGAPRGVSPWGLEDEKAPGGRNASGRTGEKTARGSSGRGAVQIGVNKQKFVIPAFEGYSGGNNRQVSPALWAEHADWTRCTSK